MGDALFDRDGAFALLACAAAGLAEVGLRAVAAKPTVFGSEISRSPLKDGALKPKGEAFFAKVAAEACAARFAFSLLRSRAGRSSALAFTAVWDATLVRSVDFSFEMEGLGLLASILGVDLLLEALVRGF